LTGENAVDRKKAIQLEYHAADLGKRAKVFALRFVIVFFLTFIPAVAAFFYGCWSLHREGRFSRPALAVFIGCILIGIVVNTAMLRRFRCPNCGMRIRKPLRTRGEGTAVEFHCPQCESVWDSGLNWPEEEDLTG
jgi:predicted RNA-binding Zn-ribbon protein involved in translation (DUF1610 family)